MLEQATNGLREPRECAAVAWSSYERLRNSLVIDELTLERAMTGRVRCEQNEQVASEDDQVAGESSLKGYESWASEYGT